MILEKLSKIQNELRAPKGQKNTFGNYNYRSAEDILEAVKPLCFKHGVVVNLSDEVVLVGDRYYVKACAMVKDIENKDIETVYAYAREEETKKGMDGSQITGTASSYARKYAMNGLFAIDDQKDADTDEQGKQVASETKATSKQVEMIKELLNGNDMHIQKACDEYKVKFLEDLTVSQASELIKRIQSKKK